MHESNGSERYSLPSILLLLVSGILIGGGAILPGISGGVLCVVFGVYRPLMEVLAHPKAGLPKYWRMLLPIGVGWLIGFLLFAKVIQIVLDANATIATCAMIGLIAGTIPALWKQAGSQGRGTASYIACAAAFLVLFGVLLFVRTSPFAKVTPNIGWFLFTGVLWGISFIVPGMTSSSILISLGLLEPLVTGVTTFDLSVILPWLIGLVAIVLLLAKLVNHLFERRYAVCSHAVVGVVLASTLVIVPVSYAGLSEFLLCLMAFAIGFFIALLMSRLENKLMPNAEQEKNGEGGD